MNHPFEPVYDENSKILILGTFPSVKSREADFYYAHPQNRFWKVVSSMVGETIPQTIQAKKAMLLKHYIAIWDVVASCDITGSSDRSITSVVPNDLTKILRESKIEQIYANGNKAFELYREYCYADIGMEIIKLPSTSPANAVFSLEKLITYWDKEIILDKIASKV